MICFTDSDNTSHAIGFLHTILLLLLTLILVQNTLVAPSCMQQHYLIANFGNLVSLSGLDYSAGDSIIKIVISICHYYVQFIRYILLVNVYKTKQSFMNRTDVSIVYQNSFSIQIKSKQYSQLLYVSHTDIVIRMELLINIRSLKLYEVHLKIDLNKAFNTLVNTCALDIQHFDGKIQKQVHCPVLTEIIITCHLSRVTFGKMSYLFLPRKTHGQHSLVSKRNSKKYGERMTFRSLF